VANPKAGCDHQWLKHQLGHASRSTLIYSAHGTYIDPSRLTDAQRDPMPKSAHAATNRALTPHVVSMCRS
jgi:hypothetical protein